MVLITSGILTNPQTIENDTFITRGTGTGLAFTGGASVEALVQGDSFQNNLVGISITGDGTNAGDSPNCTMLHRFGYSTRLT